MSDFECSGSLEDKEQEERTERFVTSQQPEPPNITRDDINKAVIALLSFFQWMPIYLDNLEDNTKVFVDNKEWINSLGDRLVSAISTNANIAHSMVEDIRLINSFHETNLLESILTLKINADKIWRQSSFYRETMQFIKKIPNSEYPLLSFYTSDFGFRLWFSRSIKISFYSREEKRLMQLKKINESVTDFDDKMEQFNPHYLVNYKAEQKLLSIYKYSVYLIMKFLDLERQRLSFYRPDLNVVSDKVYRGEKMKPHDFENLVKKLQSRNDFTFKMFCEAYTSTSTKFTTAKSFGNVSKAEVKVIHVIHMVNPEDRELEILAGDFPDFQIVCGALNIEEFSEFRQEKEIFLWKRFVIHLDVSQQEDDIWLIHCISNSMYPFDLRSQQELKQQANEYALAFSKVTSWQNAEPLKEYYLNHSDDLPRDILHCLNGLALFKYAKTYLQSTNSMGLTTKLETIRDHEQNIIDRLAFLKTIIKK